MSQQLTRLAGEPVAIRRTGDNEYIVMSQGKMQKMTGEELTHMYRSMHDAQYASAHTAGVAASHELERKREHEIVLEKIKKGDTSSGKYETVQSNNETYSIYHDYGTGKSYLFTDFVDKEGKIGVKFIEIDEDERQLMGSGLTTQEIIGRAEQNDPDSVKKSEGGGLGSLFTGKGNENASAGPDPRSHVIPTPQTKDGGNGALDLINTPSGTNRPALTVGPGGQLAVESSSLPDVANFFNNLFPELGTAQTPTGTGPISGQRSF